MIDRNNKQNTGKAKEFELPQKRSIGLSNEEIKYCD